MVTVVNRFGYEFTSDCFFSLVDSEILRVTTLHFYHFASSDEDGMLRVSMQEYFDLYCLLHYGRFGEYFVLDLDRLVV